jgi:hypothetical protein
LARSAFGDSGPVTCIGPGSRRIVEQRDGLAEQTVAVADRGPRVVHGRRGPAVLTHERLRAVALVEDVHADQPDSVAVGPVRRREERGSFVARSHLDAPRLTADGSRADRRAPGGGRRGELCSASGPAGRRGPEERAAMRATCGSEQKPSRGCGGLRRRNVTHRVVEPTTWKTSGRPSPERGA